MPRPQPLHITRRFGSADDKGGTKVSGSAATFRVCLQSFGAGYPDGVFPTRQGLIKEDLVWDILIIVDAPKVTNEIEDKFRYKLYDIEPETGQLISVFIYHNLDKPEPNRIFAKMHKG